jgi:hypothetical protein
MVTHCGENMCNGRRQQQQQQQHMKGTNGMKKTTIRTYLKATAPETKPQLR